MTTEKCETEDCVVFRLFDKIDMETFSRLQNEMFFLITKEVEDRENLRPVLLISSGGGSFEVSLSIFSFLQQLPQDLTTIALGCTESAAAIIYMAGKTRFVTPTTLLQFHRGLFSMNNCPYAEVMSTARYYLKKHRLMAEILADAAKISIKTSTRWLRDGASFSADEAVAKGLAHGVLKESFLFSGLSTVEKSIKV